MDAILVLEDGKAFTGQAFGATGECAGECVFNTSLTGYQEVLTDPSYKGQIVTMTCAHIGNTGINDQDPESARPFVSGFIMREACFSPSNWRSREDLAGYLARHNIMALTDLDTRALTRHLRTRGAMKGIMSTDTQGAERLRALAQASPSTSDVDLVAQVTCAEPYTWTEGTGEQWRRGNSLGCGYHIVVYDCGVKRNMLRLLVDLGCRVTVVPATMPASAALAERPDGVLFSNGPGDPECVPYVVESARQLLGKTPIFGICLGQQVLGLALGGRTYKLRFGHHGGNQPVQDLRSGQVAITSQNHNFVVDMDSLPAGDVEGTHINLNDRTLEGLRHKRWPLFSVQYHPEASPGPHDAESLFRQFIEMISEFKRQ
jgi:carbamoyl-phosphate synthase small subunit